MPAALMPASGKRAPSEIGSFGFGSTERSDDGGCGFKKNLHRTGRRALSEPEESASGLLPNVKPASAPAAFARGDREPIGGRRLPARRAEQLKLLMQALPEPPQVSETRRGIGDHREHKQGLKPGKGGRFLQGRPLRDRIQGKHQTKGSAGPDQNWEQCPERNCTLTFFEPNQIFLFHWEHTVRGRLLDGLPIDPRPAMAADACRRRELGGNR